MGTTKFLIVSGEPGISIINQNIKHSVPFVLWVAQSVEQIKLSKLFFAFEAGQRAGAAQDGV
jgi:hypothetical protein